jgi:hypothetical protein
MIFALFATQLFFTDPVFRYAYAIGYIAMTVMWFIISPSSRQGLVAMVAERWPGKPAHSHQK